MSNATTVLLCGVGGQGTILAADLLACTALASNYDVKVSEIHGMSQRGGSVSSQVRYGEKVMSPVIEKGNITYMGVNSYSRKWQRLKTYGGKLVENVTQAAARDILAGNMPLIEDAGYSIVLTVHDEVITEAPDTEDFNDKALSALLSTNPEWAPDIPLNAGGFEAYRYRKD